MKKILLASSLCLAPVVLLAANISEVVFNDPAHSVPYLKTSTIPNLGHIDYVVTAGNYAWAADGWGFSNPDGTQSTPLTISFYDGTRWSAGEKIEGTKELNVLYPSYPTTGEKPTAWLVSYSSNHFGDRTIFYFDGTHWSKGQSAADLVYSGQARQPEDGNYYFSFAVNNGVAYLFGEINDSDIRYVVNNHEYLNSDDKWSRPKQISRNYFRDDDITPGSEHGAPFVYYNDNDERLYKIDAKGQLTEELLPTDFLFKTPSYPSVRYASPDHAYYSVSTSVNDESRLAYKSPQTNGKWIMSAKTPSDLLSFTSDAENAGLLCTMDDESSTKLSNTAHCVNINAEKANWSPVIQVPVRGDPINYTFSTRSNGSWISYVDENHLSLYDYDLKSGTVTDFCAASANKPGDTPQFCSRQYKLLMAYNDQHAFAQTNRLLGQHENQLYYYNRAMPQLGWQAINIGDIKIPTMSTSITSGSLGESSVGAPLSRLQPGQKLWLFDGISIE